MYARIRSDLILLQKAKAAIATDSCSYDRDTELRPSLSEESFSRALNGHLAVWVEFKGVKPTDVKHLVRTDARVLHKIVARACCIPLEQPLGPMQKAVWDRAYGDRYRDVGEQWIERLKLSGAFEIDWSICGRYALMPIQHRTAYPQEHIYTHVVFTGRLVVAR